MNDMEFIPGLIFKLLQGVLEIFHCILFPIWLYFATVKNLAPRTYDVESGSG